MNLTDHFTLHEFTNSETAERLNLDNTPPDDLLPTLTRTAQGMERIRTLLGHAVTINSAYRAPAVNSALGSKPTSQHCKGEAVDFTCSAFGNPREIARFLSGRVVNLGIDQLIAEYASPTGGGWVHVSFSERPRHALLTIDRQGTHQGIA